MTDTFFPLDFFTHAVTHRRFPVQALIPKLLLNGTLYSLDLAPF